MKATEIYRQIMEENNTPEPMRDSVERTLRNKMTFIIERIALRKTSEFRKGRGGAIVIPDVDAPVVKTLIEVAISGQNYYVEMWFNGSLNLDDAENCMYVYDSLKYPLNHLKATGEADGGVVNSWLATIRGVLNVNMCEGTIELKDMLEKFRTETLVSDAEVDFGSTFKSYTEDDGGEVARRPHFEKRLSNELMSEILKDLHFQGDYFSVLKQIVSYMIMDAEAKASSSIEAYALLQNHANREGMEGLATIDGRTMVSEYRPWFLKAKKYLKNHPGECWGIEERIGVSDLEELFD